MKNKLKTLILSSLCMAMLLSVPVMAETAVVYSQPQNALNNSTTKTAFNKIDAAVTAVVNAITTLRTKEDDEKTAKEAYDAAVESQSKAQSELDLATTNKDEALAKLNELKAELAKQQEVYDSAVKVYNTANSSLTAENKKVTTAQTALDTATKNKTTAETNLSSKETALETSVDAYKTARENYYESVPVTLKLSYRLLGDKSSPVSGWDQHLPSGPIYDIRDLSECEEIVVESFSGDSLAKASQNAVLKSVFTTSKGTFEIAGYFDNNSIESLQKEYVTNGTPVLTNNDSIKYTNNDDDSIDPIRDYAFKLYGLDVIGEEVLSDLQRSSTLVPVENYVAYELFCSVNDEAEGEQIAKDCGIQLQKYTYKVAIFYTEEDLDIVISRAESLGYHLEKNRVIDLYSNAGNSNRVGMTQITGVTIPYTAKDYTDTDQLFTSFNRPEYTIYIPVLQTSTPSEQPAEEGVITVIYKTNETTIAEDEFSVGTSGENSVIELRTFEKRTNSDGSEEYYAYIDSNGNEITSDKAYELYISQSGIEYKAGSVYTVNVKLIKTTTESVDTPISTPEPTPTATPIPEEKEKNDDKLSVQYVKGRELFTDLGWKYFTKKNLNTLANRVATQYSINLVEVDYLTHKAYYHTTEDPEVVVERGKENGWAEIFVNPEKNVDGTMKYN